MVDREARDKLADLIESYLDERITSFEFADAQVEITSKTKDRTVSHVAWALWHFYDDLEDHTVDVPKEVWDYIQRLLLLLRSDAEIRKQRRIWSWRQAIAAVTLIGFLAVAIPMGFGKHLFVVAIPFGLISVAISDEFRKPKDEDEETITLAPFASITEVLCVRRTVPGFRKRRYPPEFKSKRKRSRFVVPAMWVVTIPWLMLSPVVLALQLLPGWEKREAIEM